MNWKIALEKKNKPKGNHALDELQYHEIQDTRGRQGQKVIKPHIWKQQAK